MHTFHKASGLFEGRQGHCIPTRDTSRLNNREYFLAGKIVAMSIVHGGRAPNSFSRVYVEKMRFGEVFSHLSPNHVPDPDVRNKILKVNEFHYGYSFTMLYIFWERTTSLQ